MENKNRQLIIAGLIGFLAVAVGAFGAHGLKNVLSERMLQTYNTGVLYHLVHSVVLLAIALTNSGKFYKAFLFFFIGIVLFSFSLYFYSISGIALLAFITPIGGISLLIGWALIFLHGLKNQQFI